MKSGLCIAPIMTLFLSVLAQIAAQIRTTVTQKKSQRGPCDLFVPGPIRYEAYRRIRGAGSGVRELAYPHWYPQGRRRGDRQGRGLAERCRLPRRHFLPESRWHRSVLASPARAMGRACVLSWAWGVGCSCRCAARRIEGLWWG